MFIVYYLLKFFLFTVDILFEWDSTNEPSSGDNGSSGSFSEFQNGSDADFRAWVGAVSAGGSSGFGSSEMDSVFR